MPCEHLSGLEDELLDVVQGGADGECERVAVGREVHELRERVGREQRIRRDGQLRAGREDQVQAARRHGQYVSAREQRVLLLRVEAKISLTEHHITSPSPLSSV